MKKFALSVLLLLVVSSCAFAANWTVGGTWNYTLEGTGTFNRYPATMKEAGTVVMSSAMSSETEMLSGYAIAYNGTISIPSQNYSYDYSNSFSESFSPLAYVPGETLTLSYTGWLDGVTTRMTLKLTQTGENTITGTATQYVPLTGETNYANISAHRNTGDDGGSGGGCNTGMASIMLLLGAIPLLYFRKK